MIGTEAIKLNIGAGDTVIDGFTAIDRKFGTEAFPLNYADDSVDEIRASHILEHFSFGDAQVALAEWVRVLKPGGRIRISVPDVDKTLAMKDDPNRLFYLMGGQTDADDFHRSAWDEQRLGAEMIHAGIARLKHWESANTDTAAEPCSLNLEGFKATADQEMLGTEIKTVACMTLPRYESVAARNIIAHSCRTLGIDLLTSQGVFWGQCMQRMFNEQVSAGVDWILSIDSDSLFTADQLSALMQRFADRPDIDALAALQCRRGQGFPLMTVAHETGVQTNGEPIKVTTAHFGLTLIRTDVLKQVEKPWFNSRPDADGEWEDNRLDDDIWFWHQWRLANRNIYVDPLVSIGHLEETVAVFDDELEPHHIYVNEWKQQNGG